MRRLDCTPQLVWGEQPSKSGSPLSQVPLNRVTNCGQNYMTPPPYRRGSIVRCDMLPGLSVRAGGGGILPPVGVWCAGCGDRMKVGIKSFQTKVKARKSDKRFQSYRHLKIGYILRVYQYCLRCIVAPVNIDQPPVPKFPDNPETVAKPKCLKCSTSSAGPVFSQTLHGKVAFSREVCSAITSYYVIN